MNRDLSDVIFTLALAGLGYYIWTNYITPANTSGTPATAASTTAVTWPVSPAPATTDASGVPLTSANYWSTILSTPMSGSHADFGVLPETTADAINDLSDIIEAGQNRGMG